MRRDIPKSLLTAFTCALFIFASASLSHAQNLQRLSAQFLKFDDGELHAGPGDTVAIDNGVSIFEDHVKVPANVNVLYVTLSATGDVNASSSSASQSSWFTCMVDGAFCNGGSTFATGTAGWIALQGGVGDTVHDSAINYTWCTPIAKGKGKGGQVHDVQLRMASDGGGTSFIEGMHVFIDANKAKDSSQACVQGSN